MISFKLKLKFMKWALVTLAITVTEMILVPVISKLLIPSPYDMYVIITNIIIGMPIGAYYFILVMSGYKRRCNEYIRLKDTYTRYPEKPLSKMLLLEMDASLCEREVSRQIKREFPGR